MVLDGLRDADPQIPVDIHAGAGNCRTGTVLIFDQSGRARLQRQARQVYTGRHHPLVVVRIHAHRVTFQVKRKLAVFHVLQLVLVQIGPAPYSGVDHVRETFATSNLNNQPIVGKFYYCYLLITKI